MGCYDAVGLFEDELFIDCVDTEFYLRARARDCHALIVPGTMITHGFGQFTSWTPPWFLRMLLRKRRRGPEESSLPSSSVSGHRFGTITSRATAR